MLVLALVVLILCQSVQSTQSVAGGLGVFGGQCVVIHDDSILTKTEDTMADTASETSKFTGGPIPQTGESLKAVLNIGGIPSNGLDRDDPSTIFRLTEIEIESLTRESPLFVNANAPGSLNNDPNTASGGQIGSPAQPGLDDLPGASSMTNSRAGEGTETREIHIDPVIDLDKAVRINIKGSHGTLGQGLLSFLETSAQTKTHSTAQTKTQATAQTNARNNLSPPSTLFAYSLQEKKFAKVRSSGPELGTAWGHTVVRIPSLLPIPEIEEYRMKQKTMGIDPSSMSKTTTNAFI
eukprot:g1272.t1